MDKLNLFWIINNSHALHGFARRGATVFLSASQKNVWRSFLRDNKRRYFRMTDSTRKRVERIPLENITGTMLSHLSDRFGENGFLYFTDKLHFIWSISETGIDIIISETERHRVSEDPLFEMSRLCLGYIRADFISGDIDVLLNNPLDVVSKKESSLMYKDESFLRWVKQNRVNKEPDYFNELSNLYIKQQKLALTCFRAFLFIYLAKIIDTTTVTVVRDLPLKERIRNAVAKEHKLIIVDTIYDESNTVINPFSVSGHFRNQRIGKGRMQTRLIYIDEFMKVGYRKKAKKIRVGMNAGEIIAIPVDHC